MSTWAPAPPRYTEEEEGVHTFFLLDFVARYAVDRCGATDDWESALASVCCVVPIWVWCCSLCLMLVRVEMYWALVQYSVSLLTLAELLLLLLYSEPPPVRGCGPSNSFPNPQCALAAYAYVTFTCSLRIGAVNPESRGWLSVVTNLQFLLIPLAVMFIGFASPASAVAGVLVGSTTGAVVHAALEHAVHSDDTGCLMRVVRFVQRRLGAAAVDTILRGARVVEDALVPPPPPQAPMAPMVPVPPLAATLPSDPGCKDTDLPHSQRTSVEVMATGVFPVGLCDLRPS